MSWSGRFGLGTQRIRDLDLYLLEKWWWRMLEDEKVYGLKIFGTKLRFFSRWGKHLGGGRILLVLENELFWVVAI